VRPVIPFVVAVPRKKLLPVAAPAKGSARASRLGEGVWLVTVHGEHDLTTQDSLAAAIQLVDFSGAVIIDFSDADFIDTSTLAQKWLEARVVSSCASRRRWDTHIACSRSRISAAC
jgi:hypothetical protein